MTQHEFHQLDYAVMQHAFASHNALGRFCDEAIYQSDLAQRLTAAGLGPVRTEVPVTVSWKDFRKTYYLDLVVGDAVVYELKAVITLMGEHDAQLLNYLLLLGLKHGKLLNFHPPSLQWRFVSTTLTPEERRAFQISTARWCEISPACLKLRTVLDEILQDWGAFLELQLYQEALIWFLGGEPKVVQRIKLFREGAALGTQRIFTHAPTLAFQLTPATGHQAHVETNLLRFLAHTNLQGLQWINLNHRRIELTTLFPKMILP